MKRKITNKDAGVTSVRLEGELKLRMDHYAEISQLGQAEKEIS